MTGPLHHRTHLKTDASSPPLSLPSPKLPIWILIKATPNSDQTPRHRGFKPPSFLLHSCPKLFPSYLRNVFHVCPFLFMPTFISQRHRTFLLDYSDPALLVSPLISNVLGKVLLWKVLLWPSFTPNWWFFVMLGPYQNHLRWVIYVCAVQVLSQINWAILLSIHCWDSLTGSYLSLCSCYKSYRCKKSVMLIRVLYVLWLCCVNEVWIYCTKQ